MDDSDYLSVSDGNGDAALMHITGVRLAGSTTISVDGATNVPTKFIGTTGDLLASGFLDPATKMDFKGHLDSGNLIIDEIEPGSTDNGNTEGQVVIIKPNTGWADRIATFIKNMTGKGTAQDATVKDLTADNIETTADVAIGGTAEITGALTLGAAVKPSVGTTATGATITPVCTTGIYTVTALAADATIAAPSGSPVNGQSLILRIKDNGTARALTWNAIYRAFGQAKPTTTTLGKTMYVSLRYNSADSKWDVLSWVNEV